MSSSIPSIEAGVPFNSKTLKLTFTNVIDQASANSSNVNLICTKTMVFPNDSKLSYQVLALEKDLTISFSRLPGGDTCTLQIFKLKDIDGNLYELASKQFNTTPDPDSVPKNVKILTGLKANKLAWDTVPGAVSYKIRWIMNGEIPQFIEKHTSNCFLHNESDDHFFAGNSFNYSYEIAAETEFGLGEYSAAVVIKNESQGEAVTCP